MVNPRAERVDHPLGHALCSDLPGAGLRVSLDRRGDNTGRLLLQGRDVDERAMVMDWDLDHDMWVASERTTASQEQQEVLDVLDQFGPMTITDVAAELGVLYDVARSRIVRMRNRDVVTETRVGNSRFYARAALGT